MVDSWVQIPTSGGGAVSSVNSLIGTVVLTKSDISLANVNNTSDAAKPISTSTQTALNLKQAIISTSTNQMIYVSFLAGSDSTGDGTYSNPFKSVSFCMSSITDSSITKPYVINLQANRQIETGDVFIKPYTSIVGMVQRATYFRINGGQLKPSPLLASNNSWNVFKNLYFGGSSVINFDLQAIGGSNSVFIAEDCTLTGAITFKGRNAGGGDYVEMYNCLLLGALTFDSTYCQLQSFEVGGAINFSNSQAVSGVSSSLNNLTIDTSVTATNHNLFLNNVCWPNSTLTTVGTVTLNSYKGMPNIAQQTLSGSTTVVNYDNASAVPYVASDATKWLTTPPTDTQNAINTLAARVKALGG